VLTSDVSAAADTAMGNNCCCCGSRRSQPDRLVYPGGNKITHGLDGRDSKRCSAALITPKKKTRTSERESAGLRRMERCSE
jgi:hypothetical protein